MTRRWNDRCGSAQPEALRRRATASGSASAAANTASATLVAIVMTTGAAPLKASEDLRALKAQSVDWEPYSAVRWTAQTIGPNNR